MKQSKNTLEFFNKMPEFDPGISATLYLSTAKQVNKYDSALNDLQLLMREFQKLEVTDGFDTPPLFFDLVSGQKFSDYAQTSQRLLIFTKQELIDLKSLYEMIRDLN